MLPSRRAFLFGRRTAPTPWVAFCQRLTRLCEGRLDDDGEAAGIGRATLRPTRAADVRHARALCAEYGVRLTLAAVSPLTLPADRSALMIDPAALDDLQTLPGTPTRRWRAGPGCRLGQLTQAGLAQFAGAPRHQTLAEWLAGPAAAAWPLGRGGASGIHSVDALLADGTVEPFGPFGENDGQPLRTGTMQRLIPALFQLIQDDAVQEWRTQPIWPGRYRLDALLPTPPASINLAHLLCGHGGTLAWIEHVVLFAVSPVLTPREEAFDPKVLLAAARLDAQVKTIFDPTGVFLAFTNRSA